MPCMTMALQDTFGNTAHTSAVVENGPIKHETE